MEKTKKRLFYSALIALIYIIIINGYAIYKNQFITSNVIENISNIILLILSIFGIVYFFILSRSKLDLNEHRKMIMFISIIFFILDIISGVLGFISYNDLDVVKKEKRELPKLEDVKGYNKYIYLLALIICLFILFVLSDYLKGIIGFITVYLSILIIMVFVFRKQLIRDFKVFKEYFKEYNALVLKTWGKALLIIVIINLIISITTGIDNATNQESLELLFKKMPILVAILSMFYAPIAEELMFRGVFRKFLKNKWLFILISGYTFGIIHVIDDFQSYSELLYIFVYGTLGCFLASLYYKTNNICTNMYFHFLQNTLSVIGMILLYFIG